MKMKEDNIVYHKFINYKWNSDFSTNNVLLNTPYDPEVLFIGTFNHGWDWNPADFFYGRNMYMWPILGNLFLHNSNHFTSPRTNKNDNPTLNQIFDICKRGKIAFTDIVLKTNLNISIIQQNESVIVNGNYNWDTYSDSHLNFMGSQGWLVDNVQNIIDFININKSIKHIYFTFKSGNWLVEKMQQIISSTNTATSASIFTPTGQGFRRNLTNYPNRAWSICHCWVWNNLPNGVPINKQDYGHLDHEWLRNCGVNPNDF